MEPITTELRKLMAHTVDGFDLNRPLVECDRAEFERLCDQIDAVHEGLERENDRLKVELDRALGELDDMHKSCEVSNKMTTFMHSGMSITHELREYAHDCCARVDDAIHVIADRIDAEHESNVGCTAEEWDFWESTHIELPKDADGEYIHIGDKVTCGRSVWEVTGFRLTGGFWGICCTIFNDQGGSGTNVYPPSDLHHYHALTVEDVLQEILFKAHIYDKREMELLPDLIAEYAAKLQLKEDE